MTPDQARDLAKSRSENAMRRLAQARQDTTAALRREVERRQAERVGTADAIARARTGERE